MHLQPYVCQLFEKMTVQKPKQNSENSVKIEGIPDFQEGILQKAHDFKMVKVLAEW